MIQESIDEKWTLVDFFKKFFSEKIVNHICQETTRLPIKKVFMTFPSHKDLYKYSAIIVLSGYSPSRRNYWETRPNTHKYLVSNSKSKNKF